MGRKKKNRGKSPQKAKTVAPATPASVAEASSVSAPSSAYTTPMRGNQQKVIPALSPRGTVRGKASAMKLTKAGAVDLVRTVHCKTGLCCAGG